MIEISNDQLGLQLSSDGLTILICDIRRNMTWQVDRAMGGYILNEEEVMEKRPGNAPFTPFVAGKVSRQSGQRIEVAYPVPGGEAVFVWGLGDDFLNVTLKVQSDRIGRITIPGSFAPVEGALEMLVPVGQGMLMRPFGPDCFNRWRVGEGVCLSMFACLGDRGALIVAAEDVQNKAMVYGRTGKKPFCVFDLWRCEVEGWYERRLRISTADRSLTAVCKRHRRRLIERNMFVAWPEKIARKPVVQKIFGALIAYLGGYKAKHTNYVAGARRLREYGFDTVFYFPARIMALKFDFHMVDEESTWISDEDLKGMREAGGVMGSFSWIYETKDDGKPETRRLFRLNAKGDFVPHWAMDNVNFNRVCTSHQKQFMREQYADVLREMEWNHYDCNSLYGGSFCFGLDHPGHPGRPLSGREDQRVVEELFSPELNGSRLISSEGFSEGFTPYYEIGEDKYGPLCATSDRVMVPMSMLVFHDSMIHNWWEQSSYNVTPWGPVNYDDPNGYGTGAGDAEKKAATDALYGCPPLVFPFGRQFGWADITAKTTRAFEVSIDDAEVRRALRAALPVTHLNRRIGPCEMLSCDLLTGDGTAQTTLFSDGTRVVANFSDKEQDTDYGRLAPNSWKEISEKADRQFNRKNLASVSG